MGNLTYQNKTTRDNIAKALRAAGHNIKRSSIRNQLLNPAYIQDWEGEKNTGYGAESKWFTVLYTIEY